MKVVIIQYNAGNIQSVLYALSRIGVEAVVTDAAAAIRAADKVIFPGVGEASSAMQYLKARGMDVLIRSLQQPLLGICLGMQLMCTHSEENDTDCLGIFDESVRKFQPGDTGLKVPQIGWNGVRDLRSPLFEGIDAGAYYYFVHGYYAALGAHTIATADYVQPYSAALHKDNFYGVQFHPEKSAAVGEQLLKNFITL
jgi:glutamine amidotransferase